MTDAMKLMSGADTAGKKWLKIASMTDAARDKIIMPMVGSSLIKRKLMYANTAARQMINVSISYDCIVGRFAKDKLVYICENSRNEMLNYFSISSGNKEYLTKPFKKVTFIKLPHVTAY